MDFLGLKNLSIIKDCIKIIKELHGIEIDIDTISLEDPKAYEVFQKRRYCRYIPVFIRWYEKVS